VDNSKEDTSINERKKEFIGEGLHITLPPGGLTLIVGTQK
jgi:hypothetical protein